MISNILPIAFLDQLDLEEEQLKAFLLALDSPIPTSIRLNTQKSSELFSLEESIPWALSGKYLKERISFTLDPLFHAGCYYVQEASSMLLEEAFKQIFSKNEPLTMLDLCAAPGGKSTHLLNLASSNSILVSNEVISSRNSTLQYNIAKWGNSNCIITQNKPADFSSFKKTFDLIVIDAPCSGEGMFRKDPNSINEWSKENVEICSARQTDILDSIMPCLKNGGILIYSTCTYEQSENDFQIEYLLTNYDVESVAIKNSYQAIRTKHGLQCYPHLSKGEGFYISVVKKNSDHFSSQQKNLKFKIEKLPLEAEEFVSNTSNFSHLKVGEHSLGIPTNMVSLFNQLSSSLYIRKAGVTLGIKKGKDFIPDHELALSIDRNLQIPAIEVDINTALKFLKAETIILPEAQHGWHLITYKNQSLGWIKSIQGRINNYFPKNQRILMDLKM
jgi:16S rRNA C967 or C1407 C5-methylase (RsmB/RsmF family)/NOL1/NOP2/fmu family ribosome biogenesis protein